tara:strand:+ start:2278 stop:6162 length:3885 start_codon:yes stop_codon:yes gene_type:complete
MADTTINTVKKEDPWTAFEPVIDDTGQEEEDPWAAFEPVIEEPEVVKTEVVNNATTSLDPAVQEEMDNRASMIEIVGIDPYNGEVVNENPTYMIPGIMDINEDVSAEFERLKTIYPEQFPEEFDVAGDKSFFGFGARKNNKVMGTAADKVFTFKDGSQKVAPNNYTLLETDDGREVLMPPDVTSQEVEQAKLSGVYNETELPEASRSMYDGFPATEEGRAAAMDLYRAYEEAGEEALGGLGVTYNGVLIPMPDMSMFSAPDLDTGDSISSGIYEGTKGIISTLAAINDMVAAGGNKLANDAIDITNQLMGTDLKDVDLTTNAVGTVDKVLPSGPTDTDSLLDALVYEGTQLLVGGTTGNKLGNGLNSVLGRISNKLGGGKNTAEASQYLVRYAPKASNAVKVLSTEAGMAAALNPDVGTLFIGENALLPLSTGITVDPESPEYKQLLAKKANILADAILGARVAQGALETTAKSAKLVYLFSGAGTLTGALRTGTREQKFVESVLQRLAIAAEPGASPERIVELQKQITKIIEDNQEVIVNIDNGEVSIGLSTLAAVQFALRNNDTETAKRILSSAQIIEQGALGNKLNTGELASVQGRPGAVLDDTATEMFDSRGGDAAVSEAGDVIRAEANAPIVNAEAGVRSAEVEATEFATRISNEISSDPLIGSKLEQLNDIDGISIVIDRNNSADSILNSLNAANRAMTDKKNELFRLIKGGRLNLPDANGVPFGKTLYDRLQVLNKQFLDAGNPKKPGNSQLGELLAAIDPKVVDEAEAIKYLSNNLTFETLYNSIRPNLSETISRLQRDGSLAAQDVIPDLLEIKKLIDDDAIKYLDDTGQVNKIDAAKTAMSYYKNTYSKFWRDGGVLQEVDRINNTSAGRLKQAGPIDATRETVVNTINDKTRLQADNILNVLMRKEGGESVDDVVDYIIADAVSLLDAQVGKPLNEVDFASVRQTLSDRASLLDGNPATKGASDKIRAFLRQMQRLQTITPEIAARISKANDRLKQVKDAAYKGALGRFFAGADGKPLTNTEEVLYKYFNDKQSLGMSEGAPSGDLVDLMRTINSIADPAERELTQKGVGAAFSKFFREKFLIASKELPNQRGISEAKITEELGGITNFLNKAEIIYVDNPENVEGLRKLLELNGVQVGTRKATSGAGNSITADKAAAITAVNKLVTLTFGALSRIGARVRSGASGFITDTLDGGESARIAENLLSNPDKFVDIANKVLPADNAAMSQEQVELLYAYLIRSQIYREKNENSEEDFMMTVADIMAKGEKAVDTVSDEMDELGLQ